MPPDRSPQPTPPSRIDAHIGARVRSRRRALGFTQDLLAERIGVTAQQVHKYESGANRVAASKLYEIARALEAPVAYFFDGLADTGASPADGGAEYVHDLVMTPEGMELAAMFPKIRRGRVRRRVLDLVKALAEQDEDREQAAHGA